MEFFSLSGRSWRLGASIPAKAKAGHAVAFRGRFLALGVGDASLYEYVVSPRDQGHWMKRTDTVGTKGVTTAVKVPDGWCVQKKPKKEED